MDRIESALKSGQEAGSAGPSTEPEAHLLVPGHQPQVCAKDVHSPQVVSELHSSSAWRTKNGTAKQSSQTIVRGRSRVVRRENSLVAEATAASAARKAATFMILCQYFFMARSRNG